MKTYLPSGKTDRGSLPALWGAGLVTAILVAVVSGFISQWIDLIILFSIGIGCLAGAGLKWGARLGHCRSTSLLAYVAIVTGLLAYGGKMYVNYQVHRSKSLDSIREELAKATPAPGQTLPTPDEVFDQFYLVKQTGSKGFIGWTKLTLQNGISIKSSHGGSSGDGLNLGYWGSLILILLEAGLSAWFCYTISAAQMLVPYCERCHNWVDPTLTYVTSPDIIPDLSAQLIAMDPLKPVPGLLSQLPQGVAAEAHGKVILAQCSGCRVGYLSASVFLPTGDKGQMQETSHLVNGVLVSQALDIVMKSPPAAEPAEPPKPA